jgi:hypothetical protein
MISKVLKKIQKNGKINQIYIKQPNSPKKSQLFCGIKHDKFSRKKTIVIFGTTIGVGLKCLFQHFHVFKGTFHPCSNMFFLGKVDIFSMF